MCETERKSGEGERLLWLHRSSTTNILEENHDQNRDSRRKDSIRVQRIPGAPEHVAEVCITSGAQTGNRLSATGRCVFYMGRDVRFEGGRKGKGKRQMEGRTHELNPLHIIDILTCWGQRRI